MEILYLLITLLATTIGAIAGIGGGIIIKPCLDAIGTYNVSTIGVLSSITVLVMATVSTIKFIKGGIKFDLKVLILSVGAVFGGFLGKFLFEIFAQELSDQLAKGIQEGILIVLLIFVLFRKYYPTYHIRDLFITLLAGVFMGTISSFLGIGGGPVNVVIIFVIFSVNMKDAAVYSIFVIFFSQLSTVAATSISPGLQQYDLKMLLFMIPAAILGGFLGSHLNRKMSGKAVEVLFNIVMGMVLLLNIINVIIFLLK